MRKHYVSIYDEHKFSIQLERLRCVELNNYVNYIFVNYPKHKKEYNTALSLMLRPL